jgi:hypothetical protein
LGSLWVCSRERPLDTVAPFSSYPITLVQNHPCKGLFVGTLRTDAHGFGTLTSHNDHRLASGAVFLSG